VSLKYTKPGKKKKRSKILNRKARIHDIEKPKETHCRFCGEPDDGTCYFHHCEVTYLKIKYGSGTACKVNDNLTVWGHHKCGTDMSIKPVSDDFEIMAWINKWYLGIIETWLI
jgi:hypothetical protein